MRIDAKAAAAFLKENDDYMILMHASPDGDTLGSGSALPVGAITSLLGAPFFLTIIFARREAAPC